MIENNLGNLRSCYRVSFSLCTVRHPQTCLIFLLNFWNCRSSHNCNLNVMQSEQQPVCARCRSVQFISFRFSHRPRKSTGWHWYKRRRWWRMRRLSTSTFAGNGKSWERTQQDTSAWRGTATLMLWPCPLPFLFLLLFPFWNIFYLWHMVYIENKARRSSVSSAAGGNALTQWVVHKSRVKVAPPPLACCTCWPRRQNFDKANEAMCLVDCAGKPSNCITPSTNQVTITMVVAMVNSL